MGACPIIDLSHHAPHPSTTTHTSTQAAAVAADRQDGPQDSRASDWARMCHGHHPRSLWYVLYVRTRFGVGGWRKSSSGSTSSRSSRRRTAPMSGDHISSSSTSHSSFSSPIRHFPLPYFCLLPRPRPSVRLGSPHGDGSTLQSLLCRGALGNGT